MKSFIRGIFTFIMYGTILVSGFFALFINLSIVNDVAGFWGIVVGLLLIPFVVVAAPIYAFIEFNDLFPLIMTYGALLVGFALNLIYKMIFGEFLD
jgi:hypothetical protein